MAAKETETVPPLNSVVFLIILDDCKTPFTNLSKYAPTKLCCFENLKAFFICPIIS